MNYYVEWIAKAHDQLERIWMRADDSDAVLRAANGIDERLASDPWSADVCLGDENILIIEPLAVDFHVDELQHKVFIIHVWFIGFLDDKSE